MMHCTRCLLSCMSAALIALAIPGTALAADLTEAAANSGSFKSFVAAVKRSGLNETLKNGGPYTVFAPTDEAISKFGQDRWKEMEKDKSRMSELLMRHVVPGKMMITEVKPGPAKTLAGTTLALKSDNGKVTAGSANVTQSDITADNGVIHAIDAVLAEDPPAAGVQSSR